MARLLAVSALCLIPWPVAGQDSSPDLVVNGSFEEVDEAGMPVGWSNWLKELPEPGCISVDDTFAHSGERSLKISHRKPTSYSMMSQQVDFEPQKQYIITGWIMGDDIKPGDGSALARLYIGLEGGNSFKVSRTFSGTFEWTYIEIGPFPVNERTWLTLIPYLHMATGTVWFDDLTFREVTPAELARLGQKMARDRLIDDLMTVRETADRFGADDIRAEASAMLHEAHAADDLPTTFDPMAGPPYFARQRDAYRLMARANQAGWTSAPPTVDARWVDPYSNVAPLTPTPQRTRRTRPAEMLQGEVEPLCLRLTNLSQRSQAVRAALASTLPGEAITWRLLRYVPTKEGGILGDPLVKVGTGAGPVELELPAGMTQDLWIMVDSASLAPGRYRVAVDLTAGGVAQALTARVNVSETPFPGELEIHTFAYAYTTWPLLKDRTELSRADLRAHRANTFVLHSAFTPWPRFSEGGEWLGLDWAGTDEQIRLHPGAKCFLLWPGMEADRCNRLTPVDGPEYPSAEWRPYAERWAVEMAQGMEERGFGYDRWALYIVDEPSGNRAQIARTVGDAVHAADPKIRIFENPYSAAGQADMELMAPVIDIWCPALNTANGERLEFCRETASEVWMYQVLGKTSSPLQSFRLAFWEAYSKDLRGFGFWDYADGGGSVWDPWDADRHDYAVVYDGDENELIPSKRWEAYRDGAEDHALLCLARDAGQSDLVSRLVDDVLAARNARSLADARRKLFGALNR